jgi:hypothetical protein
MMNQPLRMKFRAKALLCATTCLAAILVATTLAEAVDQELKNGCTSPQAYDGSLTSPAFDTDVSAPTTVTFMGWFEVEGVDPQGFDTITVEYSLDPGVSQEPRDWIPIDTLMSQAVPPSGSGNADQPYSNMGLGVPPQFQQFTFQLPAGTEDTSGVQIRIHFATGDGTYQGFRGVAVDGLTISSSPALSEDFEDGAPDWTFEPASGPDGPFWQALQNPQNVSVKSPEINPDLVTLADSGALPAAFDGTRVAWFGNVASGTFCGPDFANRFQEPPPVDTVITSGPPADTTSRDASFSFGSSQADSTFQCRLDGAAFTACGSPQSYSGLARSMHTFEVRAIDVNGVPDPSPAGYTWSIRAPTLEDLAPPQQGISVNAQQVSGTVLVGIPAGAAASGRRSASGRASQKGINFVPLSEARQVPVGSFFDTRKGTVRLQSARDLKGTRQTGTFLDSIFQVRQSRKRSTRGLTDLILKGSSFSRCRTGGGKGASAALSRAQIRRLRANASGRFRTRGRNSSATVRGTIWDTIDRCDGTLTRVRRGRVVVRDFRRKKNIVVKAGKSYLARAPR